MTDPLTLEAFRDVVDEWTLDAIQDCPLDAQYSTTTDEDGAVAVAEFAIELRARLGLAAWSRPPHALPGSPSADPDEPPFEYGPDVAP